MNRFTSPSVLLSIVLVSVFMTLPKLADGQSPKPEDQQLQNGLSTLAKEHRGDVGIAIRNLKTGEFFKFNADKPMATASLIKLPLMIAVYRDLDAGKVDLARPIELKEADKVPGSGILTSHFSNGVKLPLYDYVRLMIRYSDNTATNIVADQVGLARTADVAKELACPNTKLHSKLYRGDTTIFPERSKEFGIGSTTANEMVSLLEKLHDGTLASRKSCDAMLAHLKTCEDSQAIGRNLPGNVEFAHKTGAIANCRTDAGIIYTTSGPIAVCVLTNKNEDQRWTSDNEAELLMASVGKVIVDRFGADEESTDLQEGSFGKMVEALQRTLNARLSPSPNLSIDGDFGPATKRNVVRFQEANKIKADGIVGEATWKALGTLIETDAPVPAPEIVNSEKLATVPMASPDDPPIVTCVSWVIGDPESGNVLFASDTDEPRQAASTTKIMTAFAVLEYAREKPEILDDIITFSKAADDTVGSTAAVRVGEQVSVRNLLYGLLLPSGNDASVALAEHLGARIQGSQIEQDNTKNYAAFVALMNTTAKKIGMEKTLYKNTHGLPDDEHVTTAADLLRLASHAMKHELFREICATRQYGCTLKSEKGYERNVIWKNTNRLLGIDGYAGIKTGTTNAAGSCLVSYGERDGDPLIAVVLGSSSSPARYSDTRNLFRWAWAKRQDR